jgi:hypothetical protein
MWGKYGSAIADVVAQPPDCVYNLGTYDHEGASDAHNHIVTPEVAHA